MLRFRQLLNCTHSLHLLLLVSRVHLLLMGGPHLMRLHLFLVSRVHLLLVGSPHLVLLSGLHLLLVGSPHLVLLLSSMAHAHAKLHVFRMLLLTHPDRMLLSLGRLLRNARRTHGRRLLGVFFNLLELRLAVHVLYNNDNHGHNHNDCHDHPNHGHCTRAFLGFGLIGLGIG
jgi:hypothetical protein